MLNPMRLVLLLTVLLGGIASASAEGRYALVIGNSNYRSVAPLPNPASDAKAVAALLEAAGFEVRTAIDLGQVEMRRAVRQFAGRLADKGEDSAALVYFAGHGVQIDGENYLLPVDANISQETDVALEGVRLADVMNILDSAPSRTRIVILDACRNNPFKSISGDTGRGLAIVNAPAGSLVAYSTSPGATAEDGVGANSPFTAALVQAARVPGAPVESVFQNVRLAVHKATDGRQTPWEVTALTEPFQFFPGTRPAETETLPGAEDEDGWRQALRSRSPDEAYELVIRQDVVVAYQVFVALFPSSPFARRIRGLLDRRVEMLAWFEAVTLNSPEAFEAFLARYPNSDLAPTAQRLKDRALSRSLFAGASNRLTLAAFPAGSPQVRTVVREVRVPEIRTVTKEVIKEVPVIKEVVREVKVPVEVIREVKVPVVKEVVREVKVPVVKEVVKEVVKVVKSPPEIRTVVKTVTVPAKCNCGGSSTSPSHSRSKPSLNFNPKALRQFQRRH